MTTQNIVWKFLEWNTDKDSQFAEGVSYSYHVRWNPKDGLFRADGSGLNPDGIKFGWSIGTAKTWEEARDLCDADNALKLKSWIHFIK